MCAIVDANVVAELWDDSGTAAGQHFRRWLEGPNGQLVVGGTLKRELGSDKAARFLRELDRAGKLTSVDDALVEGPTADLKRRPSRDPGCCKSNDHHIIALAQVSGARMLFSNGRLLQQDFKNSTLINQPSGTVYSTLRSKAFTRDRRQQLQSHRCKPTP